MYSAYKLNKQGDNMQPRCTPFLMLNQFIVPCLDLTVASWPVYRFLRMQVRWSVYSHLFKNFPQLVVIYIVKGFGIVNKTEVDVLLEFYFCDLMNAGNLVSCSSAFSESSLNIWTFLVHVLLKPRLENFHEMRIPDHLTCLLRNPYTGQEPTVRTRHGTKDWFQIGKGGMSKLHIVFLLI